MSPTPTMHYDPFQVVAAGAPAGAPDLAEVRRAASVLFEPDACHELRGLPSGRSRLVRASDAAGLLAAVEALADDRGVYYTLNPVRPDLGDRAAKVGDVLSRRWLLVDVDRDKALEPDASATDAEKAAAREVASAILADLAGRGWPAPVLIDSGNGYHLLYPLSLPNDDPSRLLIRGALKALAAAHDAGAEIDLKVHNASRVSRLPGTWSRKGPGTAGRPHRMARLLSVPDLLLPVSPTLLRELAGGEAAPAAADPFASRATEAGDGRAAYVRAAVDREVARVALAHNGTRNDTLNEAAFALGTLVGPGRLDRGDVERQLLFAASRAGLGEHEAKATIRSGLEAGVARPRTLPDPPTGGAAHRPEEPAAWEPPDLGEMPAAEAFPLDVLPHDLARFVAVGADCLTCPPDFLGLAVLTIAGAAMGRSVALAVKDSWVECGSIYGAFVAPPGATKSPALSLASRPLWALAEQLLKEHRAEVARARVDNTPPPALRRIVVSDATTEALAPLLHDNPRGLVMVRDELTAWVAGLNQYKAGGKGADRQFFLSAWSGSAVAVDRKSQERGPIHIPHPFLSVLGALTPAMLSELAESKGRDDGFIDRLLFAFPQPVQVRWRPEGLPDELGAAWSFAVHRLWGREMAYDRDEGRLRPWFVRFAPRAREMYAAWFDEHCREAEGEDFPPYLAGFWSKLRAYCARLALVLEQLRWACDPTDNRPAPDVAEDATAGAIRLVGYFKAHGQRARALLRGGPDEADDDARAVARWLRSTGRAAVSLRDVRHNFPGRFGGPAGDSDLERAIGWLVGRRCLRRVAPTGERKRGRPASPSFEVNPALVGRRDE